MIDLFRYGFIRQIRYVVICCYMLLIMMSCHKKISIIEDMDLTEVLSLSKEKQKPIFLMIGGGDDCTPCYTLKKQLIASKILNRFKDDFIFYMCNVNKPENDFIYKTLLPQTIPNYYIINLSGKVVAFSFAPVDDERIWYELTSFLAGNPKCFDIHNGFYDLPIDSLLMMQNFLIQANLLLNEKEYSKSLEYVEKSIAIYPYLYNSYLNYKINAYLGNNLIADSLAYVALQYDRNSSSQSIVYEKFIKELNRMCGDKKVNSNKTKIRVLNSTIECGEMRLGDEKTCEFKFINDGENPLVILNVSYSCGCTTPHWKRSPVKQNDTGVIYVKFKADANGRFSRSLTIQSNAKNSMEKIILKGIIK